MENSSSVKCAHCGSEHIHAHKQGFNGLSAFMGFFLVLIIVSIVSEALNRQDEGLASNFKRMMSMGASAFEIYMIAATGVLAGTIGMNKIILTCINCSKRSKPGKLKT